MDTLFFPFPHLYNGHYGDGSLRPWPSRCLRCMDRPCEHESKEGAQLCKYGFNYQRVDSKLLVAGVVLEDWLYATPARKSRRRQVVPVPNKEFQAALDYYRALLSRRKEEREIRFTEEREDILDVDQFRVDYLKSLKEDIQRGLAFVHDYKQINAQISQNINVIIEELHPGGTFEDKLGRASRAERAIYEAARFLGEKLNVAKFLLRPEWLTIASECVAFRLHGAVIKYVRIYQSWFDAKNLRVTVAGSSYANVVANPQASSVIPHTLIDNAVKYAPVGSTIEIFVQDERDGIVLEVSSLGPKILKDEIRKVFRPFFRGEAALQAVEEGAGYGLYLSQLVAKEHLGTEITVEQHEEPDAGYRGMYMTTFSVRFPYRAKIL